LGFSKQIDRVFYSQASGSIVCATCDHNIICVNEATRRVTRQFAGFNDEIFDISHISSASNCIAVATNSAEVRVYDLNSFSCLLVEGHTESVLSVDSPDWDDWMFASSSKDNSVIIWRLSPSDAKDGGTELQSVTKVAVATGHTNAVSVVRFSHSKTDAFIVTVSYDSTLKLWPLKGIGKATDKDIPKLTSSATFVAHQKDITCLDVSANDKLCITGSMDKTAKLWHINKQSMELGIAGTLHGHKRGVWGSKFSANSQNVATCGGDYTVRLFSLIDLSCQKTFSGHSFAVLSVSHWTIAGIKYIDFS
jgi:U3 small nucleolar RNA-associated protein 13